MPPPLAVEVRAISKTYEVHERPPGLAAALRSVFHRRYKTVHAVSDLSFTIEPGRARRLPRPERRGQDDDAEDARRPAPPDVGRGRASRGYVPAAPRAPDFLQSITLVMGQKQQLLWDLPPADTFALNRAIYERARRRLRARRCDELDRAARHRRRSCSKPTRQLSLGERMKCELAAALLHRPAGALPRRADHRPRRLDAAHGARVHPPLQRAPRGDGAAHVALHGRRRVALPARHRHRPGPPPLRRRARRRWCAIRARQARRASLLGQPRPRRPRGASARSSSTTPRARCSRSARRDLREAVAHLLAPAGVADLTVEDPPLEEVMRELFARAAREAAEADGA